MGHVSGVLAAAAAFSLLAGCAAQPTQMEVAAADYGQAISQDQCNAIATETISSALRDAGSAQYRFGNCAPLAAHSIPILGIPIQYGYAIPVEVNAKNAYGGYTGFTPYFVLIRNGEVIRRTSLQDGAMLPF